MKKNVGLIMIVAILMMSLTGGLAFAATENEEPGAPSNESETSEFLDIPFLDNLMESMSELMDTLRTYIEELQDTIRDMVPGVGDPEPTEDPVEELEPVEEPTEEPEPAEDPIEEPAPVEEPDETRGSPFLFLGIILVIIIAIIALILFKRKHIQIVDAKTGEIIEKQKIEIHPKTRIDLTEAFRYAYDDAVRVQFLKPIINKLLGYKVVFLKDGEIIDKIDEYTGELEYLVKLPKEPEEGSAVDETETNAGESEETPTEETEYEEDDDNR